MESLFDVVYATNRERTVEHADDRGNVGGGQGRILKSDGDHNVGVQIVAQDVGGQVVDNATVGEEVAVNVLNRRKDAGNGNACTHRLGQRAGCESDGLKRVQVSGHAAEGDGQPVVIELRAVVAEQVGR